MKPILLEMRAFGPYGDRAVVDFEPLADVGLFVVSGPTGAGKSTIFDAICFALYGSLSGTRSGHADVRSHYADPAARCSVTLVFDAGGQRWKVSRQPAQVVQKLRGTGTTNQPATAVLERWTGADWEPDTTKVRDVTARCRDLVGLTLEQFERVVLLPQGRFAEVLNAKTNERSDLLRTLFGSEIFDRAAEILAEQARESERALQGVLDQRAGLLERASDAVDQIAVALAELPDDLQGDLRVEDGVAADPRQSQLSLLDITDDPADVDDPAADLPGPTSRLAVLLDGPVRRLHSLVERRRAEATSARAMRERAEAQQRMLEQRAASLHALSILDAEVDEMADVEDRIAAARSVADLASAIVERDQQRSRRADTLASIADLWSAVQEQAPQVLVDDDGHPFAANEPTPAAITDLVSRLAARAAALDRAAGNMQRLDLLQRERTDTGDRLEHLDRIEQRERQSAEAADTESNQLADESRQLSPVASTRDAVVEQIETIDRLLDLRVEADRTSADLAEAEQQRQSVVADADSSRQAIADADAEIVALSKLVDDRPARRQRLEDAERRRARRSELDRSVDELAKAAESAERATTASASIFQAFVTQTAPRLASELDPGEPCPVCGSKEHPAPASHHTGATIDPRPVDAAAVADASASASAADAEHSRWRTTVARLIEEDPGLASIEPATLDAERSDAAASLAAADEAVRARDTLVASRVALSERLAAAENSLVEIERRVERLRLAASQLAGALGSASSRTKEALAHDRAELEQRRLDAERSIERLRWIEPRQNELATLQREYERTSRQRAIDRATANERCGQLDASIAKVRAELDAELGGQQLATKQAEVAELQQLLEQRQGLAVALAGVESALQAAEQVCGAIVERAGFVDESTALAAALEPSAIDQLQARHGRWANQVATHRATLATLEVHDLPEAPPDLEHVVAAALGADERHRIVAEAHATIDRLVHVAQRDLSDIAVLDAESAEQRVVHENVQRVASVVRGQNSRRLSLENWVLSVYLHDVVQHANLHLATMSNGRYRLAVQDAPSNQVGQHGLDLVVDDAHTGRVRPSVSLSGGETFQASLALALGLADVVMLGRAGLHLDALFVDEGFGSLDADAIDQAITVLDGLRSRGSMVGVITHVDALKAALPVAIDVQPRRDLRGSTIRQVA